MKLEFQDRIQADRKLEHQKILDMDFGTFHCCSYDPQVVSFKYHISSYSFRRNYSFFEFRNFRQFKQLPQYFNFFTYQSKFLLLSLGQRSYFCEACNKKSKYSLVARYVEHNKYPVNTDSFIKLSFECLLQKKVQSALIRMGC